MKNKPIFSVIIPVFNRGHLISETVGSVLNQKFGDYEVIVVNDGSLDDTCIVLSKYQDSIKIINQENQGAEVARNNGVEHSIGEYLVFLDSDDILFPDALFTYYQLIEHENYPDLMFAAGNGFRNGDDISRSTNPNQGQICYYHFNDYLSKTKPLYMSASFVIYKRSLWNKITEFKSGTFPSDDRDFLLRNGTISPFLNIKYPVTVGYRYHENNSSIRDFSNSCEKLKFILQLERKGEYAGGPKRKMDRLAIIGGPILYWIFKGLKKHYYKESLSLCFFAMPAVIVGILRKFKYLFFESEIKKIQICKNGLKFYQPQKTKM